MSAVHNIARRSDHGLQRQYSAVSSLSSLRRFSPAIQESTAPKSEYTKAYVNSLVKDMLKDPEVLKGIETASAFLSRNEEALLRKFDFGGSDADGQSFTSTDAS
jgi:hypothetical protein